MSALVLVALLATGCGGSGEEGAAAPATGLFSGTYQWVRLTRDVAGESLFGEVGSALPRDDGRLDLSVRVVEGGASSDPVDGGATWLLDATRGLRVGALTSVLNGRLSADGSVACAVDARAGSDPSLLLLVRRATGVSQGALQGSWSVLVLRQSTSPTYEAASLVAEVTIDAAGTVHWSAQQFNFDGEIDPIQVTAPDTQLLLAADGSVEHLGGGSVAQVGALSEDGGLIVVAGDVAAARLPSIYVFVRRGSPRSASDLDGGYAVAGLELALGRYGVRVGHAQADGGARVPLTSRLNDEIGLGREVTWGLGVDVSSDGRLDLRPPDMPRDEPAWRGALAAGGAYAVSGGGTNPGDPVALTFWIR